MIRGDSEGTLLEVWVLPRAGKTQVVGAQGDRLKVRVAAPPVDGEANAELIRYLAKLVGVPKTDVEVVKGATARSKTLRIRSAAPQQVRKALGLP